jgi:hypothetical protein
MKCVVVNKKKKKKQVRGLPMMEKSYNFSVHITRPLRMKTNGIFSLIATN